MISLFIIWFQSIVGREHRLAHLLLFHQPPDVSSQKPVSSPVSSSRESSCISYPFCFVCTQIYRQWCASLVSKHLSGVWPCVCRCRELLLSCAVTWSALCSGLTPGAGHAFSLFYKNVALGSTVKNSLRFDLFSELMGDHYREIR